MYALWRCKIMRLHRVDNFDSSFFWLSLPRQSQANTVIAVGRRQTIAERHTTKPVVKVPVATAIDSSRPCRGACRVKLCATGIITTPVLAPLVNIAAHVIELQLVGIPGGHFMGAIVTRPSPFPGVVIRIPSYCWQVAAARVFIALAVIAPASRKFPLGFGGESEILVGQFV